MSRRLPAVGNLVRYRPSALDFCVGNDCSLSDVGVVVSKRKWRGGHQKGNWKFAYRILWLTGARSRDPWFMTVDWYDHELSIAET
jgi:hypothetical protein